MDWTQVLAIIASNIALFLWARTESRADYRECRQLIDAIHQEIKDFHGRLCCLEEKNINKGNHNDPSKRSKRNDRR